MTLMIFVGFESGSEELESDSSGDSTEGTFGTRDGSNEDKEVEVTHSGPLPNIIDLDFHPSEGEEEEDNIDVDGLSDEEGPSIKAEVVKSRDELGIGFWGLSIPQLYP